MATNTRLMHAPPQAVWNVLADGWLYPLWVVGASRMREVDRTWPEVGSCLHHSVGTWPILANDTTEVVEMIPGEMLGLHARARPTGVAGVTMRLEPRGDETMVVMEERAVAGPARLVPQPFLDPMLTWRNVESLRRLAFIAERREARD